VDGQVHYQRVRELSWSLLKRGLNGTYVSVEPFIFSVILMSKPFAITIGKTWPTANASSGTISITEAPDYEHLTGKDREFDTAII